MEHGGCRAEGGNRNLAYGIGAGESGTSLYCSGVLTIESEAVDPRLQPNTPPPHPDSRSGTRTHIPRSVRNRPFCARYGVAPSRNISEQSHSRWAPLGLAASSLFEVDLQREGQSQAGEFRIEVRTCTIRMTSIRCVTPSDEVVTRLSYRPTHPTGRRTAVPGRFLVAHGGDRGGPETVGDRSVMVVPSSLVSGPSRRCSSQGMGSSSVGKIRSAAVNSASSRKRTR
jgi:hypothetical protein